MRKHSGLPNAVELAYVRSRPSTEADSRPTESLRPLAETDRQLPTVVRAVGFIPLGSVVPLVSQGSSAQRRPGKSIRQDA